MMMNTEFVNKLKDIAKNYKTLYVMGCFGAPMTAANKERYTQNHEYNRSPERTAMINAATEDTFGFDCVCLIKGVLWGWNGDKTKTYGGATYPTNPSNSVPDIGANAMINACSNISTDFSKIEVGEAVWTDDHIGVYIGDGLAVECTPRWDNKVQITACNRNVSGYNRRDWKKHGKLPYITYVQQPPVPSSEDKVIETGSNGMWSWRKWSSGVAECWGRKQHNDVEIIKPWGSVYYRVLDAPDNYPFTFADYPSVNVTLQATHGNGWALNNYSTYSKNSPGNLYVCNAVEIRGIDITVNYQIIGRWK